MKRRVLALVIATALSASAQEKVTIPGTGLPLAGSLFMPSGQGPFPAVVMMHGCSGLYGRSGEPTPSYRHWAEHFRARGYVALLIDSFGPRGEKEICTQRNRRISESRERPGDARAALRWLSARTDVSAGSIHLLGWSNGGSAVLHTMKDLGGEALVGPRYRSAVAFYPGCAQLARGVYRPTAPLLIQSGGADDWTPARHCEALVKHAVAAGADMQIDVYPGAHHAFDRIDGKVRFRAEVRNASSPSGWGATVGPDPEARQQSLAKATAFIEAHRGDVPRGTGKRVDLP